MCCKGVTRQELLDLLREEGPFDMVLADFATMSAIQVAEELSIPCVINVPGAKLHKERARGLKLKLRVRQRFKTGRGQPFSVVQLSIVHVGLPKTYR